jgi:hypothetical protein
MPYGHKEATTINARVKVIHFRSRELTHLQHFSKAVPILRFLGTATDQTRSNLGKIS